MFFDIDRERKKDRKMGKDVTKAKIMYIASTVIWGTIGVFRKNIPVSTGILILARGMIGSLFLYCLLRMKGSKPSWEAIKKNGLLLVLAGVCLSANWIFLFEAYRYTSVATASLCNYMAPIFIILMSPFVMKEHLTKKKCLCVTVAFIGMILISGVLDVGFSGVQELKGVILGLGAAVLYAGTVLFTKRLIDIRGVDITLVQLVVAVIVILPYIFATEDIQNITFTAEAVVMLLIMGVVHTGIAYALYFTSIENLKTQTIAIFSYIDPVVSVSLSVLVLKEHMGILGYIGAVLILGAAIMSERE